MSRGRGSVAAGLLLRVPLAVPALLAWACTVGAPPQPPREPLVSRDAPVFDPRFRDLEPSELELSGFWVEAPARSEAEPGIPIHSLTYADLAARVSDGVFNLYTKLLEPREARIGLEPGALLPIRIPLLSQVLEAVPFSFPIPFRAESYSLGSAFLINRQGFLLTNAHVVRNATEIRAVRAGGRSEHVARIIGVDPLTDCALLHIEPEPDMTVLRLGSTERLEVGELVVAVGNPLGLRHTVTAGLVSATERIVPSPEPQVLDFLQTDTAINPGSSGGPLLDLRGDVVGINTALVEGAQAIGFAIPIDIAKAVMPLLVLGRSERGWFGAGVELGPAGPAGAAGGADAGSLGSAAGPAAPPHGRGPAVLISEVVPGSPAEAAGVRVGDRIAGIGGRDLGGIVDFRRRLVGLLPGQPLRLSLVRDGERVEVEALLIEPPREPRGGPGGAAGPRRGLR